MSGMHLLPVYYTSTNLKKKKKKKVNPQRYEAEWRKHNKFLKSVRLPVITLEEYIDYAQGKTKYKPKQNKPLEGWGASSCPSNNIPSAGDGIGNAYKKVRPEYQGTAVIGQAYNKGGLQVLSTQEAKDPMTGKRR